MMRVAAAFLQTTAITQIKKCPEWGVFLFQTFRGGSRQGVAAFI